MAVVSFRQRIDAAFDKETTESFGPEYLGMLMENWRDTAHSMRRAYVTVVVLAVVFFLVSGTETAELDLGPLRLTNVGSVLTLIPVLTSYLLCEVVFLSGAYQAYGCAVREVVRVTHRTAYENDLHYLITPAIANPSGYDGPSWTRVWERPSNIAAKIVDLTSDLIDYGLIIGAFGFLIYAYIFLYSNQHTDPITVSIGLVVTMLFFGRAVAISFAFDAGPEMERDEPDETEKGQAKEPGENASP